jgi:hypothetical protein
MQTEACVCNPTTVTQQPGDAQSARHPQLHPRRPIGQLCRGGPLTGRERGGCERGGREPEHQPAGAGIERGRQPADCQALRCRHPRRGDAGRAHRGPCAGASAAASVCSAGLPQKPTACPPIWKPWAQVAVCCWRCRSAGRNSRYPSSCRRAVTGPVRCSFCLPPAAAAGAAGPALRRVALLSPSPRSRRLAALHPLPEPAFFAVATPHFQAKRGCSKCATRVARPHRHSSRNW